MQEVEKQDKNAEIRCFSIKRVYLISTFLLVSLCLLIHSSLLSMFTERADNRRVISKRVISAIIFIQIR